MDRGHEPETEAPRPPQPPNLGRGLRLGPKRTVGLAALALLVALGAWLDAAAERTVQRELDGALRLQASHAAYAYLGEEVTVAVTVEALDGAVEGPVQLSPDDALRAALSDLRAVPPWEAAADGRPQLEVQRLAAGAPLRVTVRGRTEGLGALRGALIAERAGARVRLPVAVFVYP